MEPQLIKKAVILIAVFGLGTLLSPFAASDESFIGYPWACPTVAANKRAEEALGNVDEDEFEDTGCVSLQPETEYRILRCDENIPEKYLEKFDYPIPYTTELPRLMCEMVVDTGDGISRKLLADFPSILLLKPR